MTAERVAFGTVAQAGTETVVYTVPRHSRASLASLVLTNVSDADIEVTVRVSVAGAKFRVLPPALVIQSRDAFHLITPIAIEANETLTLETNSAGALEYYISAYMTPAVPSPSNRAT